MLLLTNIFLTFHILIVGFFFTVKLSVIFTKFAIHVIFVKIPLPITLTINLKPT